MGTRLYPMTKNIENLEKLAGVPPGTWEKYRDSKKVRRTHEELLKFYEDNPDIWKCLCIHTTGYGKFWWPKGFPFGRDVGTSAMGSTTDPYLIEQLAKENNLTIDPNLAEGVEWY